MMNIMVPLSSKEDIDKLCCAGADEFYFGFRDERWDKRFGVFEEVNRMSSFGSKANFHISEISDIAKRIKENGKCVYITLNSQMYSAKQKDYIKSIIPELGTVDGIILSDPTLIEMIKEFGLSVTMSTMAGCYNSKIINFYKKLSVNRVIIPRDVSIDNIEKIISAFPDIEFEVFIMRNGCKFSDSQCMSFHARKYGSMCACIDYSPCEICFSGNCSEKFRSETYSNNKLFTKAFHKEACGLCSVKRFQRMGIKSLKIVGRADSAKSVEKNIIALKQVILSDTQDVPFYENCLYGMNCYYNTY